MTRIAVLGATSGIAGACLKEWAARGDAELRLVARSEEKVARVATDLTVRGGASVATATYDLGTAAGVETAVEWIFGRSPGQGQSAEGPVDIVLIAFGTMPSQAEADASPEIAERLLTINGTLNLLAAQLVAQRLIEQGSGSLAVIGSVAGDRGRRSNYLYGAAKAMVATGVAGLQHRTAGTEVHITLVKPGPTATAMTDHLRGGGLKLAKVETVGHDIVAAIDTRKPVVYTPSKWALIMTIVKLLPRAVFERTNL